MLIWRQTVLYRSETSLWESAKKNKILTQDLKRRFPDPVKHINTHSDFLSVTHGFY